MRIHHLNCGAMQPYGGALFDGQTPVFAQGGLAPATLACHCLLLEHHAGLTLVDTGTVSTNPAADRARHSPFFRTIDRLRLDAPESAHAQIRALGLDPARVQNIVMTHLDFDHAAGLTDFPEATIHLSAQEAYAAQNPNSPKARQRFRPAQWGSTRNWRTYPSFKDDWFGLPATPLPGELLLISLPGHTEGHCGVAIPTTTGWLLHAADAIFHHRELHGHPMPPAAHAYQWAMQTSQSARRRTLHALQTLARTHPDEVEIICTHDPSLIPSSS